MKEPKSLFLAFVVNTKNKFKKNQDYQIEAEMITVYTLNVG